jgi:catechol 2,3-dioxygenase-like lactoylglutathione lyase family enzyme
MTDTVAFHFGFACSDADRGAERYTELGVRRWVRSQWRTTPYFDAGVDGIVEPRSRVVYGRLTDDIAVELLEVDPSVAAPMVWLLDDAGVGRVHFGHWVRDTAPVARRLLRAGGRIVMARANSPAAAALTVATAGDPEAVPDELDSCYVLTGEGQLVELVPARIWSGRLVDTFGPDTHSVIPAPPAEMLATQ